MRILKVSGLLSLVGLSFATVAMAEPPVGFHCKGGQGASRIELNALSSKHVTVALGGVETDYYTVTQMEAPQLQLNSRGGGGFKLYLFTAEEMVAVEKSGNVTRSDRVLEIHGEKATPQAMIHLGEQATTLSCSRVNATNEARAMAFTEHFKRLLKASK